MGEFSRWLLHEDRKEVFNYLFAVVLNAVFIAVAALLLWPLGKAAAALTLGKGSWGFWTLLIITGSLMVLLQRLFRVDLYSHSDAYVISGLLAGGVIQAGWSAFAALTARDFATDASVWVAAIIYVFGLLSCAVALAEVGVYYGGQIYRLVNLPLAAAAFVLFSLWPAAARALYGWFFDLF